MKTKTLLSYLFLALSSFPGLAETINLTGSDGINGSAGVNFGDSGTNGTEGASLVETVENTDDADKSITLRGGRGGNGGNGRPSNDAMSGSGGAAGAAGDATATANVTLNLATQRATLTANGGFSASGGSAGAGNSLNYGQGGAGGEGGDALAILDMMAGDLTTLQTATVNANGSSGGFGGGGVLNSSGQQGGVAGLGGLGGKGSADIRMHGSPATTTQTLSATIRGGAQGIHGIGAGLPILDPAPISAVNAEASLVITNPADGATISPTISINGGGGHGIQAQSGAFPASSGLLKASRIEATGANAIINANASVTGGSGSLWQMPSGLGATFISPETLANGSAGAEALAESLEIIATQNGRITGALTLTGGSGGARTGPSVAGNGANVEPSADVLKGTSQGGNVTLTLTANGGSRATNSQGTNGVAGDAIAVNAVTGDSTTGAVTLTQEANGGSGGGRAVSSLDHTGTTTGSLIVIANATSGPAANFSSADLAGDPTLGSAQATCHVVGTGSLTRADATVRARTVGTAEEGSTSTADARAIGPRDVRANAIATRETALLDGPSHAEARAEFTQPGPTALAVATATVRGLRDGQSAKATAVAPGTALTPVTGMTAYCLGENLAASAAGNIHAAANTGGGITQLTSAFTAFGGSQTFASIDPNPVTVFSFNSLNTNPNVAAFFANLASERHLVTCRPVQKAGGADFTDGRVITRRYGGSFQLSDCLSGGQLVLSGLGTTNREGALDTMIFTVRRDTTVVFQSTDPALFANTVTVLDDLGAATADSLFEWELVTTATSAGQTFETYFALSATASSGLGASLSSAPIPVVASSVFTPSTEPGATVGQRRVAFQLTGGAPLGALLLEVSTDLGRSDPWHPVRALSLDANGALTFDEIIDFGPGGAISGFFRLCRP